jgi:hypothetical protein
MPWIEQSYAFPLKVRVGALADEFDVAARAELAMEDRGRPPQLLDPLGRTRVGARVRVTAAEQPHVQAGFDLCESFSIAIWQQADVVASLKGTVRAGFLWTTPCSAVRRLLVGQLDMRAALSRLAFRAQLAFVVHDMWRISAGKA